MKNLYLVLFAICALSACKVIQPQAPNLPPSQLPTTPLPDSKIDVPVSEDLTPIFNDFNNEIPATFSGGGNVGPGSYKWNVNRAPFNLTINNTVLAIQDQAGCYGEGDVSAFGHTQKVCSCNVNTTIAINTTFNLSPNYYLSGNAVMSQLAVSPCLLTFANFDVTPILTQAATTAINNGLGKVNQMISQYSIIKYIQPAWNTLSQTINVPGIGFLQLNPSAVRMETPFGNGSLLNLPIGVTAKPQFYSTDPGQPQPAALPNISDAAGNGFNVTVDANIDYASLNTILSTNVAGKRINYPKGHIDIKKIQLYGVGNSQILLNIEFKGTYGLACYKGNLYFTGTPFYDPASGNLYLTNVDFDTNTTQALTDKGATWILNGVIKTFFNDQVHVNINTQINALKLVLNQAVNRQIGLNINLSGSVDTLTPEGILPQSNLLLIRMMTSGKLAVMVKP